MILFASATPRTCKIIILIVMVIGAVTGAVLFGLVTCIIVYHSMFMKRHKKLRKSESKPLVPQF